MFRINLYIYSLLYFFLLLTYLPALVFQALFRKKKTAVFDRIRPGINHCGGVGRKGRIWIHSVSVGEVNASLALINRLNQEGYQVYLSTTTVTGQQVARSSIREKASLLYFPLDFQIISRSFIRHVNPDIIILMETEIWPNFIESAARLGVPVVFMNGRISDHSYRNYLRISRLIRPVFRRISMMCMQSEIDAGRIRKIGAPDEIVRVTGSMKFDYSLEVPEDKLRLNELIGTLLGKKEGSPVWVCGSTKPNEEEQLLSVFTRVKEEFPDLSIIVAPRHPHRGGEVADIFMKKGFSVIRRSLMDEYPSGKKERFEVLVLDTVGELACIYQVADLVFMGGSLVPTGGQNVIEPAFFGKPIFFGPSMFNFREIAEIFISRKAAVQIHSPAELEKQIRSLLADENERSAIGKNARQVLEENRGAVERNLEIIGTILGNGKTGPG